jgi:hypothetical protein
MKQIQCGLLASASHLAVLHFHALEYRQSYPVHLSSEQMTFVYSLSNRHTQQPLDFKAILLSLNVMQFFRGIYTRLSLTILTGMIFLNMGFFLMEVKILELHKDRQLMENIFKIIGNSPIEEERDTTSSSFSGSALGEEEYLAGHHCSNYSRSFFFINNTCCLFHERGLAKGYLKKISPPPEV